MVISTLANLPGTKEGRETPHFADPGTPKLVGTNLDAHAVSILPYAARGVPFGNTMKDSTNRIITAGCYLSNPYNRDQFWQVDRITKNCAYVVDYPRVPGQTPIPFMESLLETLEVVAKPRGPVAAAQAVAA